MKQCALCFILAYPNDHVLEPYTGIHLFILQMHFGK